MYSQNLPLISIVTPSYNQGQYIRETIESVLNQDYTNIEYWVMDGGSTDETLEILASYEHDPRFHWISERDKGQSDAINKGLARCTGDIFNWLNSDDFLLPGALRSIAEAWQQLPQPAIIYGFVRLIDSDGNNLGYVAPQSPTVTLEKLLHMRTMISQPGAYLPLAQLRTIGGVDTTLHYLMDLDIYLQLAKELSFHFVAHDIAAFRVHPNSKTVSATVYFVQDARTIYTRAVANGMLTTYRANANMHLFGVAVHLDLNVNDRREAFRHFIAAIQSDWRSTPWACYLAAKGLIRTGVGERFWEIARTLKLRLGV